MADNSRSKYVGINVAAGFVSQVLLLLLSFLGRTVFLRYLSIDYLGVNGLYSQILTVLSLAELGIGNVMAYNLYKPIADGDKDKIRALLGSYKRLYLIIAAVITGIGLALVPFLKYIIQSELSQRELIIYYLIYLISTSASYLAAHKSACIKAHQEVYVTKKIDIISSLAIHALQIVLIVAFRNYTLYLSSRVLNALLSNFLVSRAVKKRYPSLIGKGKKASLPDGMINENVKATFLYKIGITILTKTDNILISAMIGTVWVGYYSNYYMVALAVQAYVNIIISSLIPSIGNLNTEGNAEKSRGIFFALLLFFHWCAAYGGISLYLLFGDLIPLWLGPEYLLRPLVVLAIALNFYVTNMASPVWMFRETLGMFTRVKYLMLEAAVLNIVLSLVLGKLFGMAGILFATALSRIFTHIWYEPRILFGEKLKGGLWRYWRTQFKYMVLTAVSFALCYLISLYLPHSFFAMVGKGFVFMAVTLAVFAAGSYRSEEFLRLSEYAKYMLAKLRRSCKLVLKL